MALDKLAVTIMVTEVNHVAWLHAEAGSVGLSLAQCVRTCCGWLVRRTSLPNTEGRYREEGDAWARLKRQGLEPKNFFPQDESQPEISCGALAEDPNRGLSRRARRGEFGQYPADPLWWRRRSFRRRGTRPDSRAGCGNRSRSGWRLPLNLNWLTLAGLGSCAGSQTGGFHCFRFTSVLKCDEISRIQ